MINQSIDWLLINISRFVPYSQCLKLDILDKSNVHSYNTRSSASDNFCTKPSRLSVQANFFSRMGVKVWNAIPQALRNLSKNAFKRKLKQILFNILGSQDSYVDLSEILQNVKSW